MPETITNKADRMLLSFSDCNPQSSGLYFGSLPSLDHKPSLPALSPMPSGILAGKLDN